MLLAGVRHSDQPLRARRHSGFRAVPVPAGSGPGTATLTARADAPAHRGPRLSTAATIALPVVLMLARVIGELTLEKGSSTRAVLGILGTPVVALLLGVVVTMFTVGVAAGFRGRRSPPRWAVHSARSPGYCSSSPPGGGFKQTLVDAGVADLVPGLAKGSGFPVLVLGWLIAVGIRLATGSATVATITAAGIGRAAGRRPAPGAHARPRRNRCATAATVMVACRDRALTAKQPYGVWGGLSESERAALLRDHGRVVQLRPQPTPVVG